MTTTFRRLCLWAWGAALAVLVFTFLTLAVLVLTYVSSWLFPVA